MVTKRPVSSFLKMHFLVQPGAGGGQSAVTRNVGESSVKAKKGKSADVSSKVSKGYCH